MNEQKTLPKNATTSASKGWLERLGLFGLASIEAPLLAALVTQNPLLLIGVHGTAKSLLLTRVAAALGLDFRHYNASLLNFDDLVGFPLPSKDGKLEYVGTPASIWGAGAVIFDEISRCRPDIQNKLFPIIHERRVQGVALEGLRYRWAAMNPPSTDEDENGYAGSEPLDAALADRFAFVVEMPTWAQFTPAQQLAIIRAIETPIQTEDAQFLSDAINRTRRMLEMLQDSFADGAASYVQTVVALLAQAGLVLSPRRTNLLYRGVLAVNAAALAIDSHADASEATLCALRSGLPHRAQGIPISELKLLTAHREAFKTTRLVQDDPLRAILCASGPLEKFKLAIKTTGLSKEDFSTVVADVLAQLPSGEREAVVVHLFETGSVGRLHAAIATQAAELYRGVAVPPPFPEHMHEANIVFTTWDRIKDLRSRLDPRDSRAQLQANAIASLFARQQLDTPYDAERAFAAFADADRMLRAA